jgi:hypothetical protein
MQVAISLVTEQRNQLTSGIHVHLLLYHYQADSQYFVIGIVCQWEKAEISLPLPLKLLFQTHKRSTVLFLHLIWKRMALANIEKVAKHVIQKCMLNLIS